MFFVVVAETVFLCSPHMVRHIEYREIAISTSRWRAVFEIVKKQQKSFLAQICFHIQQNFTRN